VNPIYIVTLADREPYTSIARALEETVRSFGHKFHCETTAHGERPWQAKRFALRKAFEENSSEVYWIDADHQIVDRKVFEHFLISRKPGIHCCQTMPGRATTSVRNWGKRPNQAGSKRNLKIYQSCLKENGLSSSMHFSGFLVAYSIDPKSGLKLCSIWDSIAKKLHDNSTTWTDEISIGIAADTLKIPIIPDLPRDSQHNGLNHLLLGNSKGYFLASSP